MKRIRATVVTLVIGTFAVFALGAGNVAHAVTNVVQTVFVTNTTADPVPVAGTVNVGNLPATQPVSGTVNVGNFPSTAPRVATHTDSIPVQVLAAGDEYTFTGVFTTASLLSIVTHDSIEVTFNGPAPLLVAAKAPATIPLTERIQVDSVTVACKAANGHCFFRFFVVGDN